MQLSPGRVIVRLLFHRDGRRIGTHGPTRRQIMLQLDLDKRQQPASSANCLNALIADLADMVLRQAMLLPSVQALLLNPFQ